MRIDSLEAATIPKDDSERILAAVGWESDPRRLPMLRALLRDHVRRIYFHSYEESRNRAAALDRTRRTLLRVARTIRSIPEGCPLSTWVFVILEENRVQLDGNPDFWRLLVIAEKEWQTGDLQAVPAVDGTAAHPALRPLVSLYRRFLETPGTEEVESRANWPAAQEALESFLCAQFAETADRSCRSAPGWRRWLAARPWRRPRNLLAAAGVVVALAVGLVVVLTVLSARENQIPTPGTATHPESGVSGTTGPGDASTLGRPGIPAGPGASTADLDSQNSDRTSGAGHSGEEGRSPRTVSTPASQDQASVRINGARCESANRDSLRFAWLPAHGVTEYRLCLITAKRDTLGVIPGIEGTHVTVPVDSVPGMRVPGSFIFRIDGLSDGQLRAVSDPQPFHVP